MIERKACGRNLEEYLGNEEGKKYVETLYVQSVTIKKDMVYVADGWSMSESVER